MPAPPLPAARAKPLCWPLADATPAGEGFRLHIVHLSDADILAELEAAKAAGLPLSVETCPHYLAFAAEEVPDGDTRWAGASGVSCCAVGGFGTGHWERGQPSSDAV